MRHLVSAALILAWTAWPATARAQCKAVPSLRLAVVAESAGEDGPYVVKAVPDDRPKGGAIIAFADAAALGLSLKLNDLQPPAGAASDANTAALARVAALALADGVIVMSSTGKATMTISSGRGKTASLALAGSPTSLGEAETLALGALGYSGYVVGHEGATVVIEAPPALLRPGLQSIALAASAHGTLVATPRQGTAWLALMAADGKRGRFRVLFGDSVPCGTKVVMAPATGVNQP